MRSLPRVIKASTVYIDHDNKVQIKAELPENIRLAEPEVVEKEDETPEISPEEQAQTIVNEAKAEAEFILRSADIESRALTSKAREESERMMTEAQIYNEREGQRILEECQEKGYKDGIKSATTEGEGIKAEAQTVLEEALWERDSMRKAVEPDAVNLVINIAEKLLGNAVKINPQLVVSLIRQGFADATMSGQITVRVSDDDYDAVLACKEELMAAAGGTAEIDIVRDLSLGQTDCVIDTPFGGIDVSLTPQFESLRENLIFLLEKPV
jgi:flagellar assembly protein FliH